MSPYILVALGGASGSLLRYWLSGIVDQRIGETYPWGTFAVNLTGCAAIGLLAALSEPEGRTLLSPGTRQLMMIGVCGGYTTYSSFGLQTLNLLRAGQWGAAFGYVALTNAACLGAVWLGHAATTGFLDSLQRR